MNISEENFTFWQNSSHDERQVDKEFSQWKSILSLVVLSYWLLLVLPTTFMNFSVLLAVKKSSINKAMAIVHTYMLALNTFIKVCLSVTITIYIPPMIRFCLCSIAASSISFFLHIFTVSYQPFTFASLAVFQLLIIKGKRKLVNTKSVGITLIVITVVAVLIPLFFTIVRIIDGDTFICSGACPGSIVAHTLIFFIIYVNTVWMPSLLIVVIVTTWSCILFKRYYAGNDADLNRRIIVIPLAMPIIITLTTIITFGILKLTDRLPTISTNVFVHNWTVSIKVFILLLSELSNGLSYPCLVLFLYPTLWMSWKMLFKFNIMWWKRNKVTPK